MSRIDRALALLAALLAPLTAPAQDSTSGDDALPMTQRICDKSPGNCTDMQSRHELCQKHPEECQGSKTDNAEAHDRAASVAPARRQPAAAAPVRQDPRGHRHARKKSSAPNAMDGSRKK